MREKIKDKGRLEHILNSIDVLLSNKGKYEYADVEKDPIVFFGFVKHVEIIGEAVYMLTKEFRATHPEVDWDVIEGMMNVLVHGYYKIRPKQWVIEGHRDRYLRVIGTGTYDPDFKTFKKFSESLAWETEVWIADMPDHMIHLNGDKFLGPRRELK